MDDLKEVLENMGVKTSKPVLVPLDKIHRPFQVRKKMSEDRVLYFWDLFECRVEVDPVLVSPCTDDEGYYNLIDGWHRCDALDAFGKKEVLCIITAEPLVMTQMITCAFLANTAPKGPLPQTHDDNQKTVELLLEAGASIREITSAFSSVFPARIVRKYLKEVKQTQHQEKVMLGVKAVSEQGLTVKQAAETYDIEAEPIRRELRKLTERGRKDPYKDARSKLSEHFESLNKKNAHLMRSVLESYEDKDLTEQQVNKVFVHLGDLMENTLKSSKEWHKRYNALSENTKTARA